MDTSSTSCGLALVRCENINAILIDRIVIDRLNAHSEKIMAMMDTLFRRNKVAKKKIGLIAVTIGPGSFTGLRIGLSVAKGLSFGWNRPVVGVPTLDSIADRVNYLNGVTWIALTSRKSEFYTSAYEKGKRVADNTILKATELNDRLTKKDRLITDDPDSFKGVTRLVASYAIPDPYHVAKTGHSRFLGGQRDPAETLVPDYWQGFRGMV